MVVLLQLLLLLLLLIIIIINDVTMQWFLIITMTMTTKQGQQPLKHFLYGGREEQERSRGTWGPKEGQRRGKEGKGRQLSNLLNYSLQQLTAAADT